MLNYTRSLTSHSTIKLVDGVDVGDGGDVVHDGDVGDGGGDGKDRLLRLLTFFLDPTQFLRTLITLLPVN